MSNKEFARLVYAAAEKCSDISPLFITAQAVLESGWGKSKVGENNLFGIKAGKNWQGKKVLVQTTEILKDASWKPSPPEKVLSVSKLPSGKYRYTAQLYFRDYETLEACLLDHFKVLSQKGFADAWAYRKSPIVYAQKLQDSIGSKYATDPDYVKKISAVIDTVKKLLV